MSQIRRRVYNRRSSLLARCMLPVTSHLLLVPRRGGFCSGYNFLRSVSFLATTVSEESGSSLSAD
ncbi:hypothetical protein F2Q70_00032384 [Brassica cretica]|uniref:Uncharacterized protein n=1 Tax=Brassica cretica TaxID=69181 RepID=A0A8S9FHT0_BRACR|nr:hypothetical protein F2Q70_00032384 [Brassica cretica]